MSACLCRYRWEPLCEQHGLELWELDQRREIDEAEHARIVARFEANRRLRPMDPMRAIDEVLINRDVEPDTALPGSDALWGP